MMPIRFLQTTFSTLVVQHKIGIFSFNCTWQRSKIWYFEEEKLGTYLQNSAAQAEQFN